MSIERHRTLIDSLCKLAGLSDPRAMYESANFNIEGTHFSLMHSGSLSPDISIAYCDFGELRQQNREHVLAHLLAGNLALTASPETPAFAYNPEDRHILLVINIALSKTTPEQVMARFSSFAAVAADWRKNGFGSASSPLPSHGGGNALRLRLGAGAGLAG